MKYRIKEVKINTSRKLNLGNYETVDLSAGMSVEILEDTSTMTEEEAKTFITEAYNSCREFVKDELTRQYEPYKALYDKKKDKK